MKKNFTNPAHKTILIHNMHNFYRFEMTLKEMIEEARMMAETPDLDNIRSSPETTVQDSEFSSRKSSISQGILLNCV